VSYCHGTPARRASLFLIGLTALLLRSGNTPQGQEEGAPKVFRSESNLVVLHVNVFNGRSDAVPNLPQSAFHVAEDGAAQTLTFFSNEDLPVAIGLLIDNSSSMLTRRAMVVAGTRAFAPLDCRTAWRSRRARTWCRHRSGACCRAGAPRFMTR
jgi:hypothetical protein